MAVIRSPREHSHGFFARAVSDAFRITGEEIILLRRYRHFEDPQAIESNSNYDPVYKDIAVTHHTEQSIEEEVKQYYRLWAIVTTDPEGTKKDKRGVTHTESLNIQFESNVVAFKDDIVLRVGGWTLEGRPTRIIHRYLIQRDVKPTSVRDGAYSQLNQHIIGSSTTITRLPEEHYAYKWNAGRVIPSYGDIRMRDWDGKAALP